MIISSKTKFFLKEYVPQFLLSWVIGVFVFLNKLFLLPGYIHDYYFFKKKFSNSNRGFVFKLKDVYPCLAENTVGTSFDSHYVFHTAWAARVLSEIKPDVHVDVSSSVNFVTLLSAFIPVKFYDLRPATIELSNLSCGSANLLELPFDNDSIKTLSCMHVIEHVGLGRYGDAIDFNGDLKAIAELKRVLSKGGSLLFVVPIGQSRIQFNAHRIYSYDQIMSYFSELKLKEFSLIKDSVYGGGLTRNATKEMADLQKYGCGCFWFVKE